jgi:hypothetical protein
MWKICYGTAHMDRKELVTMTLKYAGAGLVNKTVVNWRGSGWAHVARQHEAGVKSAYPETKWAVWAAKIERPGRVSCSGGPASNHGPQTTALLRFRFLFSVNPDKCLQFRVNKLRRRKFRTKCLGFSLFCLLSLGGEVGNNFWSNSSNSTKIFTL